MEELRKIRFSYDDLRLAVGGYLSAKGAPLSAEGVALLELEADPERMMVARYRSTDPSRRGVEVMDQAEVFRAILHHLHELGVPVPKGTSKRAVIEHDGLVVVFSNGWSGDEGGD